MADREHRIPGPDHPLHITPNPSEIRVLAGDLLIAETRAALTLSEAAYPPVNYIPRGDVDMRHLRRSATVTWCPYKGECSYYTIEVAGAAPLTDAVWSYEAPFDAAAGIKDHLAFYTDKVRVVETAA